MNVNSSDIQLNVRLGYLWINYGKLNKKLNDKLIGISNS